MIDSIKRMSLDLHSTTSNESVRVKRSDTGRKICISLVDGGLPYTISDGCYAYFTAKKPDGNILKNRCSIENNTVIYRLTEQTTSVVGRVDSEIKLYGADGRCITSSKFTICVYDTVYSTGDNTQPDKTDPILQSKSVTPSETAQTVTPDSGFDGLSSVSVGAVSNTYIGSGVAKKEAQTYTPGTSNQTIASGQYLNGAQTIAGDADLVASNIKKGVSIFNVTGTYGSEPSLQNKSVTPSAKNQVVVPDTNYDGLAQVTVAGDADLVAGNIKKGVDIFGVTGSYEATGGTTLPTLTNPGTADDLAEDKQFIDANGNVVTGTVATTNSTVATTKEATGLKKTTAGTTSRITMNRTFDESLMVRAGDTLGFYSDANNFGDASASDVAKGKTFTSVNGLKVTGTHEFEGGIIPTGTKTITANGTYDVASYAYAQVNVPTTGGDVVNGEDIEVGSLSELHAWSKYTVGGTTTETVQDTLYVDLAQKGSVDGRVYYADSYSVVNGALVLNNPTLIDLYNSTNTDRQVILGKYINPVKSGGYYLVPSDAVITRSAPATGYHHVSIAPVYELSYSGADGEFVGIVVSENSNAYPQNGEQDGYKYVYNGTLDGSGGAVLPTLTNPGTAGDLAEGKQLIGASGNVVTGTNTFRDIKTITIEEV